MTSTLTRQALKHLKPAETTLGNFEPLQYEHIELDDAEIEESLRQAREAKHFRLQREAYQARISQPEQYGSHTAEELFAMFKSKFDLDGEQHEKTIKNLCCYFAKDPRSKLNMEKGLLVLGNLGSGKSSTMRFFQVNQLHSFKVDHMLDVTADYKTNGEMGISGYNANFTKSPNYYGLRDYGYCFDDAGAEETPAKHYGESKNVLAEIIQIRYANAHLVPFNSTHITSNLTEQELAQRYGSRVYDRMLEMFNLVVFDHGSFRK
jgi:DNA replication protein DnaC